MANSEVLVIGVVVVGFSIIGEWLLILGWNRSYFTVGLPIIAIRIPVGVHRRLGIPPASAFEEAFEPRVGSSWVFKEISSNEYAFRERVRLTSRATPLTHGLLIFDHESNQIVVKGFINWSTICFLIISLGGLLWLSAGRAPIVPRLALVLGLALIPGLAYLVERSEYSEIARFAAEAW